MNKRFLGKERGITIIALVVTIVVLLILAGISIAAITGDNGIIEKGDKAKEETEIATYKEQLEVIKHGEYADGYTLSVDAFLDKYAKAVQEDKMFKEAREVTTDHENKVVIVVTKEGYRFEVTIEDTTYVGNEDGEGNTEVDISKVKISITSSPENWTNGKVKVKITSNVTRISKEYSIDGGKNWNKYENEIEAADNGTEIQARGVNEKNEKTEVVKKKIENIDRLEPNIFVPTIKGTKNRLEITANTTDKDATTKDGKSGIKGYKFSKDNGSSWTGLITEGKYTYENVQSETTYPIKVKAIDNAENEVETNTINGTTEEEIILPNPQEKIQITKTPTNWTNGTVTVKMTNTATDYKIQYSKDDRSWQMYTGDIIVENNNETIYARLYNQDTQQATESISIRISNIDRLKPNMSVPTLVERVDTIEVTASATDKEATRIDGKSGIRGYRFSKDGGNSWTEEQTSNVYTFGRLIPGTSYRIKVQAIDNAGNEKDSQELTGTTQPIPGGNNNIYFNYSPNIWTNGNVIVTITATTSNYRLQYSKDGDTWYNYDSDLKVTMTENGVIYARMTDGTNYGITATGNVSNIDRILPTATGIVNVVSQSEATIKIEATDRESGIASITNKTTDFIKKENDTTYKVTKNGTFEFEVRDKAGNINIIPVRVKEFLWEETIISDTEWYSYNDVSANNHKANVNSPKLLGNMKPIKYIGPEADTQGGSKWANAMTSNGSMFVWIPRYAYKITEGYHSNIAGTIEVAFIDMNNRFLNGETGTLTTNPEEAGAGTTKWLVHPAFTSSAEYGGGFGEVAGIWVGKFETTGTYANGDTSKISVEAGVPCLGNMTINEQYRAGKTATFGEYVDLNSHMAKNSEYGAIVYLAHSKYGTNKQNIEKNINDDYTGGTNIIKDIYTTNKMQSTTYNATGIYGLNGGMNEAMASYLTNRSGTNSFLEKYVGVGDIYGATEEEKLTSSKYKTVYAPGNSLSEGYEIAGKKNKGDAIYETSNTESSLITGAWFNGSAYFPHGIANTPPFFARIDGNDNDDGTALSGTFSFGYYSGR